MPKSLYSWKGWKKKIKHQDKWNYIHIKLMKHIVMNLFNKIIELEPIGVYAWMMIRIIQFGSVAQSCQTVCDLMNCSTPGLPVHHQLPEFMQTQVHRVSDAIQPSHPLLSPSPPAPNPSQHQSLFQWVSSSHEVAKVLEFQLYHQSFQRADLL